MMIPPVIRIGPPPRPNAGEWKRGIVVLTKRGWIIARWCRVTGLLEDIDRAIPATWRLMHPEHVLCWMPEDGS